ncbi:MAG: FYDLN acid domain-containing protein [Pseudomonadota bacterium]|nr:FYDLN acid domain-containing protein [Pseudomonadota bacterium]
MQDKSKLGKRYQCFQCGLKFYDLNRPEPLCPKCGADQRENPNPDPREAILARFKGKGGMTKSASPSESFEDEEEAEEDVEIDEAEDLDEEEDDLGEGAEIEEED